MSHVIDTPRRAEHAADAEKKNSNNLSVLCVLCVKVFKVIWGKIGRLSFS
jgi:hypothetical protein